MFESGRWHQNSLDGEDTLALVTERLEGSLGKVEGAGGGAGGAHVSNLGRDGLAVVGVLDGHLAAAVGATVVAALVDGNNEVGVRVDSAASTGVALLEEVGGFTRVGE